MVTQDAAAVVPKVNKMKMKKMKKKKSKKKKMKGTENLDSESEGDKLDLEEKVYPLSHYISDQEELVNQMFLTIRGSKLEAMLPPVLKSIPLKELKRLCLHELQGMSKKRILCCINGQVMEGSSGSEDEEEEKEEIVNQNPKHSEGDSKGEKRKTGDGEPSDSYLHKKIKVEPGLEDETGSGESKSVLELLELEMRARIIKTMLEKGDEGKKITEDAIAAVIQSAKKITVEGVDASGTSMEMTSSKPDSKNGSQERKSDREGENEDEVMENRRRGRRRDQDRRENRRRRHDDGKRSSKQQKRDGSYSDDDSHGRSYKKKESNSSKQHVAKKKITRKEFEERMKRAKKNRTYRQRKSSEDEENTKEDEQSVTAKKDKDENTEDKTDKKSDSLPEGNKIENKTEGEASEKEEGEIDSNEEEEGACSPSDISSGSRYSSSRSSSRSYSRSPSRSPYRSRQRKSRSKRTRSRSRSRSRSRRRSYSRSYSRSRTPERRRGRSDYQQRSFERRSRDHPRDNEKKDIKKTSPEDISPSREEDWGHKCDIEFVDSEEDFDNNLDATKKDSEAQKTLPVNRIERASISFSLQKKPVGIAQNVDLDDLPLKKKEMRGVSDVVVEAIDCVKPTKRSEEIVISSDSEAEVQTSKQNNETDGKNQHQHQQLVTNASNSTSDAMKKTNHPSSSENINVQSDSKKPIKKSSDSQTQGEETKKDLSGKFNKDTCTEQTSSDEPKTIHNVSKENIETEKEKQGMEDVDKGDTGVDVKKGESPTKNSKDDNNLDHSECEDSDSDDASDQPKESNQVDKNTEKLRLESDESVRAESTENCKEKSTDDLEEKAQDSDTVAAVGGISRDVVKVNYEQEGRLRKSESHMIAEQCSEEEMEQTIEKGQDHKDPEGMISNETTEESKQCKEKGEKVNAGDVSVSFERKEEIRESEILDSSVEKDAESTGKEAGSIYDNQIQDVKDNEDVGGKEVFEDKTVVEPLRRETRSTEKQLKSSQKIEMVMRERLWMKRSRKKKEKAKEKPALLTTAQPEDIQSPSQKSELEAETSQSIETPENEEMPLHSPTVISDTDTSQPTEEPGGEHKQVCSSPKQDVEEVSHEEDKIMKKLDQDTEIIGVIETSKDNCDSFDDMELGGSSWSMRWLQSEKVQKVVTSSKMLSRVRKKIQRKEKATKVVMAEKVEEPQKPAEQTMSVIGSIEEYERLFGTKVNRKDTDDSQYNVGEDEASGSTTQVRGGALEPKTQSNPVFGSDDDGEDSEEEALWSKIIKK